MRRLAPAVLLLLLLLPACSGTEAPADGAGSDPESPVTSSTPAEDRPSTSGTDEASESGATPSESPHPVSLPALMEKEHDGGGLRLGPEVYRTATQVQHQVTYRSGDLTISGRLAVPAGRGPFPAIVLAHGYIDPAVYVNGQGMTREREWLAAQGYVVLHVDYRNHAGSEDDPESELDLRLGYTEDVINAVHALRKWDGPVDDERIAVGGRSMGGGVVYNVLTVAPGLVDAGVVWAPVSSDTVDNFNRWIRPDPGRSDLASRILRRYGEPARNRGFWRNASPRTFFDRVTEPVLIHHGTSDDTCPIAWSHETDRAMRDAGVDVTLEVYEGEEHAFGPQFFRSMELTRRFLEQHLRG